MSGYSKTEHGSQSQTQVSTKSVEPEKEEELVPAYKLPDAPPSTDAIIDELREREKKEKEDLEK